MHKLFLYPVQMPHVAATAQHNQSRECKRKHKQHAGHARCVHLARCMSGASKVAMVSSGKPQHTRPHPHFFTTQAVCTPSSAARDLVQNKQSKGCTAA